VTKKGQRSELYVETGSRKSEGQHFETERGVCWKDRKIDFGKDIMKKQCKNLGHQPGNLFSVIHCMKSSACSNSNPRKLSHGTTLVSFKLL